MNVLFISSGNSKEGISQIVLNQGKSLENQGVKVDYYTIKGKGIMGYFKNIAPLRHVLKKNKYDIVHAHYSLSGIVASIAGAKPLIVSLMGSDVKASFWLKKVVQLLIASTWEACIVKSSEMKQKLGFKKTHIIPNGIDLDFFCPIDTEQAQKYLGWNPNRKHVLFPANPVRPEKNYLLASESFELLNQDDVEIHFLNNVPHSEMPYYYSASAVVLLTSKWEGSPNVIKEAMACNCPIVTTKVGDVTDMIGSTDGCFICGFDPLEIASKLRIALAFNKRTSGRERTFQISSTNIAERIISIYQKHSKR